MCFSFLLFCLSSLGIRREDRVYSPQTRVSWLRQRRKRSGALLKEADVPNVRPCVLPARQGSQPARAWAGPRAPGWGLGASLLCAPRSLLSRAGRPPRAEPWEDPCREDESAIRNSVVLCQLLCWGRGAGSPLGLVRETVTEWKSEQPSLQEFFFEGFSKIALSPPA